MVAVTQTSQVEAPVSQVEMQESKLPAEPAFSTDGIDLLKENSDDIAEVRKQRVRKFDSNDSFKN